MLKVEEKYVVRRARSSIAVIGCVFQLALLLGATAALAGDPSKEMASDQMKWGYQAARRGYWLEALDRFERANDLTPGQPRILNNIAVALEASGRFEEALLAYQTALAVAPNDRVLQRNFGQFKEFYATQVAEEEPAGEKTEGDDPESEKGADGGGSKND